MPRRLINPARVPFELQSQGQELAGPQYDLSDEVIPQHALVNRDIYTSVTNSYSLASPLDDIIAHLQDDSDVVYNTYAYPNHVPFGAGPNLVQIGWKQQRQRRDWEREKNLTWPKIPETGQNYHISHIKAKADGGSDTLDNIEPEHPVDHIQRHKANGDFSRWAQRRGQIKGPAPGKGPKIRGLGLFGLIPTITGILSGRIRLDDQHFGWDMIGYPSPDDIERENEERCRARGFPSGTKNCV